MTVTSALRAAHPRRAVVVLLSVLLVIGGAVGVAAARSHRNDFRVSASPASQTIDAGDSTTFRLRLDRAPGDRARYKGPIKFRVSGLPGGARVTMPPGTRGDSKTVTVHTTVAVTPPGSYRLTVSAKSAYYTKRVRLTLVVLPVPVPLSISGDLASVLLPGLGGPLNLALTNPNNRPVSVTGLSVALTGLTAPNADPGHGLPCTLADFAVDQFSGTYPVALAASATRTLSDLGVSTATMPVLRMQNTSSNQDGCKGSTLALTYTAAARGGN
jgi:hypothetical protein